MQLVLLSGGSGMRLWPLSNNIRSKQFLRLLEGGDESIQSIKEKRDSFPVILLAESYLKPEKSL